MEKLFSLTQKSSEARSSRYLSSFGPVKGFCPENPGMLTWSWIIMMSPTLKAGLSPPAALVTMRVSTPIRWKIRTGKVTWEQKTKEDPEGVLWHGARARYRKLVSSFLTALRKARDPSVRILPAVICSLLWKGTVLQYLNT